MNKQENFDDHLDRWECTVCGHVNKISEEEIVDEDPEAVSVPAGNINSQDGVSLGIGDTIFFGHYEQDGDLLNGPEPIEWIILDGTDSSMMLISKYPLDYQAYNDKKKDTTWAKCSLREWLNDEFIEDAFYPAESAVIAKMEVDNGNSQTKGSEWDTNGGKNTSDQVYLLSYNEYSQYIEDDSIELNPYVKKKGADGLFNDNTTWWLRSPGKAKNNACFVGNGKIESASVSDKRCIRPVIWLFDTAYDWDGDYYNRVMAAYNLSQQGNYAEAVAITDMLGDYWGSKLDSISYRVAAGDAEFKSANYNEAIEWYTAARDFAKENYEEEDAAYLIQSAAINEQLLECRYQQALDTMDSGDIDSALELLTEVGQYKDSMDLILKCMEQKQIQKTWLTQKIGDTVNAG